MCGTPHPRRPSPWRGSPHQITPEELSHIRGACNPAHACAQPPEPDATSSTEPSRGVGDAPRPSGRAEAGREASSSETVRYKLVGEVRKIEKQDREVTIRHEAIPGFMEAMTMGYRVDPPSLLEGLKFGDKVRFTIDVPKKAIVKIEKMQ